MKSRFSLAVVWFVLVAVAVIGRLWQPTWQGQPLWNVTPMAGVALAAGAVFPNAVVAASVPLVALGVSNLVLPAYGSFSMGLIVFAAMTWPVFLGKIARSGKWLPILGGALATSLVFFVTTNFACWALTSMYPQSFEGLIACFSAALPFYRLMPVGDLVWTTAIFTGLKLCGLVPSGMCVIAQSSQRDLTGQKTT
ncbi:MAG: DUF6580 family putative transport protein [Pirellulales bacterium]